MSRWSQTYQDYKTDAESHPDAEVRRRSQEVVDTWVDDPVREEQLVLRRAYGKHFDTRTAGGSNG